MDSFYSIRNFNKSWLVLIIIGFSLFNSYAMAESIQSVKFSWLPNSESDLAGYKIYYGEIEGGPYPNEIDIGKPDTIDGRIHGEIDGLDCNRIYYFICRAYNSQGEESDNSTQIVITNEVPGVPKDVVITPIQ